MDAEFHCYLAESLLGLQKLAEAETEIRMSLLLKPTESRYRKVLGDCLLQQIEMDLAILEYRSALDNNPDSIDAGDIKNKIDYIKSVVKP